MNNIGRTVWKSLPRKQRQKVFRGLTSPDWRVDRVIGAKLGLCPFPDYLIIGTQKGGTTSLYRYLSKHPKVRKTLRKEIHFFTLHYSKGLDWYLMNFPIRIKRDSFITGEASPYYLFHPHVPRRVAETLPGVKIVVLLRNPIDRAYSQYHHAVRRGHETLSFEDALARERTMMDSEDWGLEALENNVSFTHKRKSYLSRGIYVEQLKRWMEWFPRERFLILKSEDFFSNPAQTLSEVLDFLELPDGGPTLFPRYNKGKYEGMSQATRSDLYSFFLPYNRQLSEFLGIEFGDWT
jgi:hypothetical protein